MTLHLRTLAIGVILAATPALAANTDAHSSQSGGAQTAQAGANTTDGTTTGSSGPSTSGGRGAPVPGAEMCSSYTGPIQKDCMLIVLGAGASAK